MAKEDTEALKRMENALAQEIIALSNLKKNIKSLNFGLAIEMLKRRKGKIIVVGVGKSGIIGLKIVATFTSLGHTAVFLHPVEALHGDTGIVTDGDVLIALSFSGESAEVVKIVRYLKINFLVECISVTGDENSSLARLSDVSITMNVPDEGCPIGLAPMASAVATLAVGDLLASALTSPKEFDKRHFAKLHPGGSLGLDSRNVREMMKERNAMPIIKDSVSLQKALALMTDDGQGVVGVCNSSGILVGVVTDGDVRRFVLKHGSIKDKKVNHAMTKNPKTISSKMSAKDALLFMEQYRITSVFVVDDADQKPVGMIHMHDILGFV